MFFYDVNKAQGKTLSYANVYLKEPVFSHGQLYVALSKIKIGDSLRVLNCEDLVNKVYFRQNYWR